MCASSEGQPQSSLVTRHIYPAASFRRKTGVSDQLHLRKVPSVHSTCCKIFVRSLFREILIMPLLNFHDWLHFWKHLRHFCWRKFMKVKLKDTCKWREKSLIKDSTFTRRQKVWLSPRLVLCGSCYFVMENSIDFIHKLVLQNMISS